MCLCIYIINSYASFFTFWDKHAIPHTSAYLYAHKHVYKHTNRIIHKYVVNMKNGQNMLKAIFSNLQGFFIHLFGFHILFARQQVCLQKVLIKAVTQCANADMFCNRVLKY